MFVHAILVPKCPTVVLTSMTLPSVPNRTWSDKSLGSWVESFIFPYIVVIVTCVQTCIFVMQTLCMAIPNDSVLNHKFQTFILSTTRKRIAEVDITSIYISMGFVSRPHLEKLGSEHETIYLYSISVRIVTINQSVLQHNIEYVAIFLVCCCMCRQCIHHNRFVPQTCNTAR